MSPEPCDRTRPLAVTARGRAGPVLPSTDLPLVEMYDGLLVDLDGVVYVGDEPVPGAPETLTTVRAGGGRLAFVTNNASRTPDTVAGHLAELGVVARPDEVASSAMAAARLAVARTGPGAKVLVVGGPGLLEAVREQGLRVVDSAEEPPDVVVQGFGPEVSWRQLAEASFAVDRGAVWVASNADPYLPTPRGRAPGNGALVDVVRTVTGREPEVAGKPHPPLFDEAARRIGASRPLVVGDRLDTDILGAAQAGLHSVLVLTGVTTLSGLLAGPPGCRPTYVAVDLTGLLSAHPAVSRVGDAWCCAGWRARLADAVLHLDGAGDTLAALRALTAAAWSSADDGALGAGELDISAPLARLDLRTR